MIIIGCISVINGVAVANLHHRKTQVPSWLKKLLQKYKTTKSQQQSRSGIHGTSSTLISDSSDDTLPKKKAVQKYSNREIYVLNTAANDDNIDTVDDYRICDGGGSINDENPTCRLTWVEVANLLDRFMMIVCVCLTVLSIITTGILCWVLA